MADQVILLVADRFVEILSDSIRASAPDRTIVPISTLAELNAASADGASLLISMGTSVIVPQAQLGRFSSAYNFHSASPDYPGRDPHHFAIYDGVTRYRAAAHLMTSRVDEGPIVGVEWFDVPQNTGPVELMEMANDAAIRLFRRLAPETLRFDRTLPPIDVKWGSRKTSRADFLRMCRIPPDIEKDELLRRLRAFDVTNRVTSISTCMACVSHSIPTATFAHRARYRHRRPTDSRSEAQGLQERYGEFRGPAGFGPCR